MPRGRPQRPYQCTFGEKKLIPGLYRCPDGRWRINVTGERFTEPDEHKAVERFLRWEAEQERKQAALVPVGTAVYPDEAGQLISKAGKNKITIRIPKDWRKGIEVSKAVDGMGIWAYFREMLQNDPDYVEKMVGAPGLAKAARETMTKRPVRITHIRDAYLKHSHATDKSKQEALAPFDRLVKFADASTLDDLNESVLAKWRDQIVNHSGLKSSGTISGYFSRVRNVLRLAARGEVDAVQIDAALARCKARLYPPPNNVVDDPKPITRADFHKLLVTARDKTDVPIVWRAILLMGIGAALYMEDICNLQWDSLDLDAGTFVSRRRKTGQCIRVATLWPETIEALRAVPRRGGSPYVFTSPHGTRYNKNSKINDFADLRTKAGLPDVTFSHLRDGSYTAAAQAPGVDEKFARLLAGHKAAGLQDKYVIRNVAIVKPACNAVYAAYGPFPAA